MKWYSYQEREWLGAGLEASSKSFVFVMTYHLQIRYTLSGGRLKQAQQCHEQGFTAWKTER